MRLSAIKATCIAIEDGGWIDNIPGLPGLRLKVRGVTSSTFRYKREKLLNQLGRHERLDPAKRDLAVRQALREAALLDWQGLDDDDGNPIPFSEEEAERLFANPEVGPVFGDAVAWAANQIDGAAFDQ